MRDFIDLQGASGARCRFRLWPEGAGHPPMACNYAIIREEPKGFCVLEVGETNDWVSLPERPGGRGCETIHLFTRLNVSRAIRETEHRDLQARYGDRASEPGPH